jgi:NitT/TauT family transport system permease protein
MRSTYVLGAAPMVLRGVFFIIVIVFLASFLIAVLAPDSSSWWLFPSGTALWQSAMRLFGRGIILHDTLISASRVFAGFCMAYGAALLIGLAVISMRLIRDSVLPINAFLRYIPPAAYAVLLVGAFGVGEGYKIAVIFFGIFFFLITMIVDVFDGIDQRYLDMAHLDRRNWMEILWYVVIPWSLPRLVDVGRINLGAAWTFLVIGEMVGANSGLGYLIVVSQRFSQIADIYWAMAAFGFIGWLLDSLLKYLSHILSPWFYAVALKQ